MKKIIWSFLSGIIFVFLFITMIMAMRFSKPEFKNSNQAVEKMFWKLNFGFKEIKISNDSTVKISAYTTYNNITRCYENFFQLDVSVKGIAMDHFILLNTKDGWVEIGKKENSEILNKLIKTTYEHFWVKEKIVERLVLSDWPFYLPNF